ncbi:hypothetical protein, partial [Marinospirillum sp.]|uniref:hypothetical protein n=1 Tax=Marinospirillum sp. TaxID=2183934 RepID=UPI003A8469F3
MERRTLLKALSVSGFVALGSGSVLRQLSLQGQLPDIFGLGAAQSQLAATQLQYGLEDILPTELSQALAIEHQQAAQRAVAAGQSPEQARVRYFESVFDDDYFLPQEKMQVMRSTYQRLDRVQSIVGHGNFNLLSFDEALLYARNYSEIGAFAQAEIDFLDELYHTDARLYGFYGDRVLDTVTARIPRNEVQRIPGTGHFLFRGQSSHFYDRLLNEVGDDLVLTSGVRSMVKQMHLFLA